MKTDFIVVHDFFYYYYKLNKKIYIVSGQLFENYVEKGKYWKDYAF